MRICPECGCTKVQEDGEIVCTGCGLVLKDKDVVSQRINETTYFPGREWTNEEVQSPTHTHKKVVGPPLAVWVHEQQRLAKSLKLKEVGSYLGHMCLLCGKPAKKGSKLDLCVEHAKEWQKERKRKNKQAQREREAQNGA